VGLRYTLATRKGLGPVVTRVMPDGEGEVEYRPFSWLRLEPDFSAVARDDSLADGQTDARTGILLPGV